MSDYIKRESRTFIEIADDLNDLVTELNDKIVESIREKNADVVPVVRCKDCKMSDVFQNDSSGVMARYCKAFRLVRMVADDDFCSYGERKDDDGQR